MDPEAQNAFFMRMEHMMNAKLLDFERKIHSTQKDMHEAQMNKIQAVSNDTQTFKRKGNEAQYKFNNSVIEKLSEASSNTSSDDLEARAKATQSISEGIDLLNRRQKLVKMADASEYGWRTVDEYCKNPLASDSDDEKRITRSEARAGKKWKEEKKKKGYGKRNAPYTTPNTQPVESRINTMINNRQPPRRPGNCFSCGEQGHWKWECRKRTTDTKISHFNLLASGVFIHKNTNEFFHNSIESPVDKNMHVQFPGKATEDKSQIGIVSKQSSSIEVTNNSPVGSLKRNIGKWKEIGAHEYILDVIDTGYKIPFREIPEKVVIKNNKSARENKEIVTQEIYKLLEAKSISEISYVPHVVNPLTVAFNKINKPRLVLDCRHINEFLHKFKFRLEDVSCAREIFKKGYFMFNFDLKSAYHHIEIFAGHRTYLGFQWILNDEVKNFIFKVLPFGISVAAFIFTKVTRTLINYWRNKGIDILMYLDDGLGGASKLEQAKQISLQVQQDLIDCGFIISWDKCQWEPVQCINWLGCEWNMEYYHIKVKPDRIQKLITALTKLVDRITSGNTQVLVRNLASIVGQIISMEAAMGSITRFRTRSMYECILNRTNWNSYVPVSSEALGEAIFWLENVEKLNGRSLSTQGRVDFTLKVFSDASSSGYGTYIENRNDSEVIGTWSKQESEQSSTWRELEAINRSLHTIGESMVGECVQWCTDNKNVSTILQIGSRKSCLHKIALSIHAQCTEKNIDTHVKWIPRSENTHADFLSKCCDSDDWQIKVEVFRMIDKEWGPYSIDRFATDYNTKCLRFNSRWWCKGAEAIDAFKQDWHEENNWLVPPPRLICKVINKLEADKARGLHLTETINSTVQATGIQLNAENRHLSSKLAQYLVCSKSDNTSKKYLSLFNKWSVFIRDKGQVPIPANPVHIALYMTHLLESGTSFQVVSATNYAIKWAHDLQGLSNPTEDPLINNLLETAKRQPKSKTVKKEPVSTETLIMLCSIHSDSNDLTVIRDLAMILLSFSGFLRFDELSSLKCNDIQFFEDYISVKIQKSKTDQYRLGDEIVISKGVTAACPVNMLRRYFDIAGIDNSSSDYLFKPLFRSGSKKGLIYKNKKLSYTRTKECVVKRLKSVMGHCNIGLHSLRSGGATTAANSNINERCWKRHGRWKSENAKDGYVLDSLDKRLSVTKVLGL